MNRSRWMNNAIVRWGLDVWHRLIDADTSTARQLAAICLLLWVAMIIGVVPIAIWIPTLSPSLLMLPLLTVMLLTAYGLSRTRYYAAGVVLLFLQAYLYTGVVFWQTRYAGNLALLVIPIFFATILVKEAASIYVTIALTAATLGAVAGLTWWLDIPLEQTYIIIMFLGISGVVLSVLRWGHINTLQALRRSETRYRQMFENNQAIQVLIDPRTRTIHEVNSAAAEFYGYPADIMTTMHAKDINMLPEDQIKEKMAEVMAGKGASFRFRHRLASGETRRVMVNISPVDMPEGRMLYVIVQDITEQHYVELRYRALFNQSHDAIFMLNLDGSRIEINPRASELLGYDHEKAPGMDYRDTVTREEQSHTEEVLRRLRAGEDVEPYERTFQSKDGTLIHTEISAALVRDDDGTPLHIQSVARDITGRKLAELALRASEERLKSVVDAQAEMICRVRPDLAMTFVNEAFCRFFDRGPQDMVGSSLLDMVSAEDRADFQRNFDAMITSTTFREYESTMPTHTGETRHLIWLMTPVKGKPGNGDEYQLVASDITDRKNALEQQFALALEQERTRLLTQFIQDAAHEFRTPLAVINSSTYLMEHTTSVERPGSYWAAQIKDQVQRLARLVDMLLTMTRLESSTAGLDATIEVFGFVKSVCEAVQSGHEGDAELRCTGAPTMPVKANRKLLTDAFRHLLDNAYHFTPPDGRIEVSVKGVDGRVRIDICDTGFGIPPGSMPHVFDTFWREDLVHSSPGFGLGLPIARRIIEQHNGQISIRSEQDAGTCVTVLLPAAPGAQGGPG